MDITNINDDEILQWLEFSDAEEAAQPGSARTNAEPPITRTNNSSVAGDWLQPGTELPVAGSDSLDEWLSSACPSHHIPTMDDPASVSTGVPSLDPMLNSADDLMDIDINFQLTDPEEMSFDFLLEDLNVDVAIQTAPDLMERSGPAQCIRNSKSQSFDLPMRDHPSNTANMDEELGLRLPPDPKASLTFIEEQPQRQDPGPISQKRKQPPTPTQQQLDVISFEGCQINFALEVGSMPPKSKRSKTQLQNRKSMNIIPPCLTCRMDQKACTPGEICDRCHGRLKRRNARIRQGVKLPFTPFYRTVCIRPHIKDTITRNETTFFHLILIHIATAPHSSYVPLDELGKPDTILGSFLRIILSSEFQARMLVKCVPAPLWRVEKRRSSYENKLIWAISGFFLEKDLPASIRTVWNNLSGIWNYQPHHIRWALRDMGLYISLFGWICDSIDDLTKHKKPTQHWGVFELILLFKVIRQFQEATSWTNVPELVRGAYGPFYDCFLRSLRGSTLLRQASEMADMIFEALEGFRSLVAERLRKNVDVKEWKMETSWKDVFEDDELFDIFHGVYHNQQLAASLPCYIQQVVNKSARRKDSQAGNIRIIQY